MIDILETMKSLKVLRSLKPEELKSLSKVVVITNYNKGQFIYKHGISIKYIYIILDGNVKVGSDNSNIRSIVKEVLTNQDIIGENVFINTKIRTEYVLTVEKTSVLKIPVAHFKFLVMSNAAFYQEIMSIIVLRLHLLEERMKNFIFKKAKTRIMSFLKTMGEQKGNKIGFQEILLKLNMSHKEIALLTDTSRQTVARILGELKLDNIIHFTTRKPGRILIRDMNALA